jgi:CheY-like chemotaxis protein
MPHSFFKLAAHARLLWTMLAVCWLLTGFAAQVPSAPPSLVPAPPPPANSSANSPAAPPAAYPGAAQAETSLPGAPAASPDAAQAETIPPTAPAAMPKPATPPQAADAALDPTAILAPVAALTHLEYFLDPSSALTPRDIIATTQTFAPWQGPLPRATGAVWLRLKLTPMPVGLPEQVCLHLGPAVPGAPSVWMTRPGSPDPVTIRPEKAGVYPILYSQAGGALLIRLEAWPAAGFTPWIGALDAEAEAMAVTVRHAALILLGLAALCCLLRGLIERREWRIWAGLFALAALIQGIWGLPSLPGGRPNPWDIPAILAPALALFILPHVGRNLMRLRQTMPWLSALLTAVSLLGLAAGLAPLIPGQAWMLRWLPLWPLGIAATLVAALPAVRLPGYGRYLAACLPAVLGTAPLLAPLAPGQPQFTVWNNLAPLCGLACSALFMSLLSSRTESHAAATRRSGSRRSARQNEKNLDLQLDFTEPDNAAETQSADDQESPVFKKRDNRHDPAPLLKPSSMAATAAPDLTMPAQPAEPDPETLTHLEEALRVPLDALLRQSIALDMLSLPENASQHVRELVAAGRALTGIISNLSRSGLPQPARIPVENALIDLPLLLRNAHAAVAEKAEERNLAVSWYVAPHLGRRYLGPADRLAHILGLLMENAIRATSHGSVQLWVRRDQDSHDPGHLVFTVADTGSGMPPTRRNALLPARVWELAGETGGAVRLDSGPTGTSISVSVILKPSPAHASTLPDVVIADPEALADDAENLMLPSLRIILADDASSRRQLLVYMLEGLPHELLEARTTVEAVALHSDIPARLIVFDGNMPEKELIDAVAAIRALDGERELPPASVLALIGHEAQGERLRRAGMDHILYKPVRRSILRQAVLHMAPIPGMTLPPLPHTPAPAAPQPASPQAAEPPQSPPVPPETPPQAQSETLPQTQLPAQDATPAAQGDPIPTLHMPQAAESESEDDLPLPTHKSRRKSGLLHRLLGVLPLRPSSLPEIEALPEPDLPPRPISRSVGEPRPIQLGARSTEAGLTSRTERPQRTYTPPRLAAPDNGSLLSENGVGEPMPIVRDKTPDLPAFVTQVDPSEHLSENGVGEPMPIRKTPEFPEQDRDERLSENGVGEPMPIHKAPEPPAIAEPPKAEPQPPEDDRADSPEQSASRRPSLLDLIQFVGPEAPEASTPPEAACGSPDSPDPVTPDGPMAAFVAEKPQTRSDDGDIVVLELLHTLDDALLRVEDSLARNDMDSISLAAGQMADHAERYGLHMLAHLARGMQDMAAETDGLDAVVDTMPDLRAAVARNRIFFTAR